MNQNKEKTYLKWYNKIGYGSGDIAGNVVYALLSAFVMIFRHGWHECRCRWYTDRSLQTF